MAILQSKISSDNTNKDYINKIKETIKLFNTITIKEDKN